MQNANLTGLKLRNLCLRGANLQGADLLDVNLSASDLTGANLSESNLLQAYLEGTNLACAVLERSILNRSYLTGAILYKANLRGAALSGARLILADLRKADLTGADITMAQFAHADLEKAKLDGVVTDGLGPEGWFIEGIKCSHFFIEHYSEGNWGKRTRIPKSGYFAPGEFEDRFKSRPTIEFVFEHGMNALDPAILGLVKDEANSKHPEADLRLFSIDTKGGIPQAIIEISEKVSKEDAIQLVHIYYQQTITQMNRELDGLRKDKGSLLHMLTGKTLLSAIEPIKLEGKQTKAKSRGRHKEHSDDKIKAAKTLFEELQGEGKSVSECWFDVHKKLGFKTPEAAKQAVYRFDKQNIKQK